MTIETVERYWTEFLIKARERFEEVLAESVADCLALLADCADDPRPVIRAWTAMRIRAQGMRRKVGEVWAEQVREQYESAGALDRTLAEARSEALADWMEIELHRAETGLYAEIVRRLLALLEVEQARVCCDHCGSRLRLTGPRLQPQVLQCSCCATTQQIQPGPVATLALDLGPYLWREACWDLWVAKRQAEQFVRRAKDVTLAQLKAWEQAEIDYLSAWLHERAKLLPDPDPHELELRRRLEQFYGGLEQQTVWTRAGCPRAVASLV